MDHKRERKISKNLSWILRHAAPKLNLTILPNGYVPIDELLALPQLVNNNVTLEEIKQIVQCNDKKRFNIVVEEGGDAQGDGNGDQSGDASGNGDASGDETNPGHGRLLICANQGHSFRIETDALKAITVDDLLEGKYPVVLHGTYHKVLPQIKKEGLRRMKRNHIHMAQGKFGEVVSGVRGSVEILIYIDIASALKDGLSFWESRNGVILCEGPIPPKYFLEIQGVNENIQRLKVERAIHLANLDPR